MSLTLPNGGAEILSGPSGLCPVQAFGTVCKGGPFVIFAPPAKSWYFRSRGDWWTLAVGEAEDTDLGPWVDDDTAEWVGQGRWGTWPDAGYMPEETARQLIQEALTRYCAGEPPWKAPDDLRYADPYGGEE